MMTSAEIRNAFLDFFRSRGHEIVPSASIVVKNDPTLLFTNAGMNQFKDYFLGNVKAPFPRVADTQKCLRVSGKHNDLEEVGVDTYHHTMFEMLGNWSFGNPERPQEGYFKSEAIAWSWELLTAVFMIPEDRLYITVFEGDAGESLPKDEEALSEWKKWIAEDKIVAGNKKDNFWEMGDTGPCGPCTEIHVDCRPDEERKEVPGKYLINKDHPQVIEIWNNVFIQFNRLKDGSLALLPARHVDTGMGLERLVRVLQQKQSNYDTDIFSGTIGATEKLCGKSYSDSDQKHDVAFRVIADHIRAIAFTIADGQLPSNTGAGYVIRRILRRAVRYYYSHLEFKQPLLYQLVPVLSDQFKDVFPELKGQQDFVQKVVKEEEEAFLRTLGNGIRIFENYISGDDRGTPWELQRDMSTGPESGYSNDDRRAKKIISGSFAFRLNDTYGFPIDLTGLIAKDMGWSVDMDDFEKAMRGQKDRSRSAAITDTEDWIVLDDSAPMEFVGYDTLEIRSRIVKYRKVKAKGKEAFQLVLTPTPFYAESGGQTGDSGKLIGENEEVIIYDTKKENDLIIHLAEELPQQLSPEFVAKVDTTKRRATERNHSATHLLHAALRHILGTHVTQKGSLVNDEYLRFDFSHFRKLTPEEITQVEAVVNEKIRQNIPVVIRQMSKDDAVSRGAMALFGEKYGNVVRVVTIDPGYSIELCGGTHVTATGELGFFKITSETAIASGIRRIEAVCGKAAEDHINEQFSLLQQLKDQLKNPKELSRAIENLLNDNAEMKNRIEKQQVAHVAFMRKELQSKTEQVNTINFIGEIVEADDAEVLKKLCLDLKATLDNVVIVLAANIGGKAHIALGIADAVASSKGLEAPQIIKIHVAPLIKGGGGGQKTFATAGGQDAGNLSAVITKIRSLL